MDAFCLIGSQKMNNRNLDDVASRLPDGGEAYPPVLVDAFAGDKLLEVGRIQLSRLHKGLIFEYTVDSVYILLHYISKIS